MLENSPAISTWNNSAPLLLNAMLAEHVFGWDHIKLHPDTGELTGLSPKDGTSQPIPDYLNASDIPVINPALKFLEELGYDVSFHVEDDTPEGCHGQLVIHNYHNNKYADVRKVLDVWGDSFREVCCFTSLFVTTDFS